MEQDLKTDKINKKFSRINFIKNLSEKYDIGVEKLFESLFDAEVCMKKVTKVLSVSNREYKVTKTGIGPVITKYGRFYQMTFIVNDNWRDYHVLVKSGLDEDNMLPTFISGKDIFFRIDSGCSTWQLFYDVTCECREQLNLAIKELSKREQGIIIYIPGQDGRGKGIEFKLATLYLQNKLRIDTVEAFTLLEKDSSFISLDARDYDGTVAILKFLGLTKNVILATNNPKKIETLKLNDIILKRKGICITPTKFTFRHLNAKKKILGHKY